MSYSRWLGSDWYIFWHCESGNTADDQMLAVWHCRDPKVPLYDYDTLKTDREWVWQDICSRVPDITERGRFNDCVDEFLADVDDEYKVAPDAAV